jgi:signal transduction histidine kinase
VGVELRAVESLQQWIVVQIDVTHGDEEIRRLRSSINDPISIQALPAIWDGRESDSIVSTLLDVLVTMLQLDFAYVGLSNSIDGSPVEFVQLAQRRAPPPQALVIGRALDRWLTNQSVNTPLVAQDSLRKAQANLAHATRVSTMGELTASIAHEVNQPLAAVVNNANACITLLPEGAANLEEVREALAEIIEDADRASDVIARVRRLAKRAPIEKSLLDGRLWAEANQGPGATFLFSLPAAPGPRGKGGPSAGQAAS